MQLQLRGRRTRSATRRGLLGRASEVAREFATEGLLRVYLEMRKRERGRKRNQLKTRGKVRPAPCPRAQCCLKNEASASRLLSRCADEAGRRCHRGVQVPQPQHSREEVLGPTSVCRQLRTPSDDDWVASVAAFAFQARPARYGYLWIPRGSRPVSRYSVLRTPYSIRRYLGTCLIGPAVIRRPRRCASSRQHRRSQLAMRLHEAS